jgi:hypothetical protein
MSAERRNCENICSAADQWGLVLGGRQSAAAHLVTSLNLHTSPATIFPTNPTPCTAFYLHGYGTNSILHSCSRFPIKHVPGRPFPLVPLFSDAPESFIICAFYIALCLLLTPSFQQYSALTFTPSLTERALDLLLDAVLCRAFLVKLLPH